MKPLRIMTTLIQALLDRYQAAATALGDATVVDLMQSNEPNSTAQDAAAEPCAIAMENLLKRQAGNLTKLHDESNGQKNNNPSVDEVLLRTRLNDLASISMTKFYAYRYDQLPYYWRQIYSDALIMTTYLQLLQLPATEEAEDAREKTLDTMVENLDRALIVAGGAGKILGAKWIEGTLVALEEFWDSEVCQKEEERPNKRARVNSPTESVSFSTHEPSQRPILTHDCPRHQQWSIEKFEKYMNSTTIDPRPVVFLDLTKGHWPALNERQWKHPEYLLSKTFGGRRLVPVEVGRSYVDDGWGQELIPFKQFLAQYVEPDAVQIGYLAQHDLFQQVPSLRNDIQVPDLCWAEVPGHPSEPEKNKPQLSVPQLNAWFGPAGTITPLHTDGYHNLLAQVVGTKYVRLYPPSADALMQPRDEEHGVDMSNTSALDVGVLEGWDSLTEGVSSEDMESTRKKLKDVEYWECILGPGDTLLIPMGWWHYVRSLTVSFSVSFWWN